MSVLRNVTFKKNFGSNPMVFENRKDIFLTGIWKVLIVHSRSDDS